MNVVTTTPIGEYIAKYIALRDKREELMKKHKEELKPYNTMMLKLENMFQHAMDEDGVDSLKNADGTAFKSIKSSVTVEDWDSFIKYVRDNDLWYALEKRASKTAVEEILEETGELPPGLKISRTMKINVRRN